MKKILLSLLLFIGYNAVAQTSCGTAVTITGNGTITTPSYTTSTYSSGCLPSTTSIRAIWYKFTATTNGEISVSSDLPVNNGTTYTDDTRLSIFKGSCAGLTCIGSNDDIGSTNYLSSVNAPVQAGQTYYIQWDNYWYAGNATNQAKPLQFTFNFNAVSCIKLSSTDFYLPFSTTTTGSTVVYNQAIGSPANYDVDWSTNFGLAAGSGTIVSNSTLFAGPPAYATSTITGAVASSNLRYYVRSNCGSTQSGWQGPNYVYLASTLPYTGTFEDVAKNYTDGFINFTLFNSSGTSNPANYADGGAGRAIYTFNSTTAASNSRGYTRAISLQAGEQVVFNIKSRLFSASTISPMSFNITVGSDQTAAAQTNVLGSFNESNSASYTTRTVSYTAPSSGIYYFGIHNNSPQGTTQTFLFFDTIEITSTLNNNSFIASSFNIYPNPVNDIISISSKAISFDNVSLTDINGRVVKSMNFNSVSELNLNISDLTSGIYFLKIKTSEGIVDKKIIKN